jgi:hypothetical protein
MSSRERAQRVSTETVSSSFHVAPLNRSLISDTGTEGIYIIGSSDVLLERNVVLRNDIERITGYYVSAIKIINQSHNVVVRDNLVMDHPTSAGVWYDVGNRDGVFINNYVAGTNNAFFWRSLPGLEDVTQVPGITGDQSCWSARAFISRADLVTFVPDAPLHHARQPSGAAYLPEGQVPPLDDVSAPPAARPPPPARREALP